MTQLTDTQLVLLSAASQHADGMIAIAERLKGGVALKIGPRLIALGLAEERSVLLASSGWREHGGERFGLFITQRGLDAIGLGDDTALDSGDAAPIPVVDPPTPMARPTRVAVSQSGAAAEPGSAQTVPILAHPEPIAITSTRSGSKKALVIAMLQRGEGASIADIIERTGWRPHTTRAVLTGLRKAGIPVTAVREAGCATRYRIAGSPAGASDVGKGAAMVSVSDATAADTGAGA